MASPAEPFPPFPEEVLPFCREYGFVEDGKAYYAALDSSIITLSADDHGRLRITVNIIEDEKVLASGALFCAYDDDIMRSIVLLKRQLEEALEVQGGWA